MSWHYLQEPEGEFSVQHYLAGIRSARLKLNAIRANACCSDRETESSPDSPSGTMSALLTENHREDSLMLSPVDSPAKTSQPQEKEQASSAPAPGFGKKCSESFAKFDPVSHSWKTLQCSLLGDLEPYSETWPKQGIMLHGSCSELTMSEHPTDVNASGFSQKIPNGETFFPTPISHNAKELTAYPSDMRRNSLGLGTLAACGALGTAGKLNPTWVEWLMGWPLGWTDLKPLATDKFRSWRQQHSTSLINN